MKQALTPLLIVVGTGPHSELVAKLNDITDYIELGDVRGDCAAIITWPDEDQATYDDLCDAIDGEGWEVYAVDGNRAVRHMLASGEDGGYIGQISSHAKGDIVFGGNRFRISKV